MDARLSAIGRALARVHDDQSPPFDLRAQRTRFLDHATKPARRTAVFGFGALAATLLALCVLALVRHAGAPAAAPLAFEVAGTQGRLGAWLAAPAERALPLRFADGSTLTLAGGSRARVAATSARGAQIVLEQGRVAVHVVHGRRTDFRFRAGPFELRVVGTRFELAWDPMRERLAVDLREGAVQVSGPGLLTPRMIAAGQEVELFTATGQAAKAEDAATSSLHPAKGGGPAPALLAPVPSARGERSPAHAVRADRSVQQHEGPLQLFRRAESARLAGRPERAVAALLALRERFALDRAARDSAFWLGRVYFDQLLAPGEAARWFARYLVERPHGAFAREAAGRLIESYLRTGDTARARHTAEVYLAGHPDGPHAELARRLLDTRAVTTP
jgi:TolA-binding protein